jgi:hypothetical protein
MTPLERRCRLLLLAYPADYRQVRAEEMLDTLLECSPAGRSWPLLRDCRAMIVGGLRVRAAQNHLSTAANLRLAAMLGCLLYLSYSLYALARLGMWYLGPGMGPHQPYPQLAFAPGLLACAALLVVRPGGRKGAIAAIVAVAALIAGAATAVIGKPVAGSAVYVLAALLVLAVLALLSRGAQRLPRLWLWPPGLVAAAFLLAPVASFLHFPWYVSLLMQPSTLDVWYAIAVLAFAWIVIDARPAVGVAIFLGLAASARLTSTGTWVKARRLGSPAPEQFRVLARIALINGAWSFAWELLAAALVLVALSAWRLRRQAMQ